MTPAEVQEWGIVFLPWFDRVLIAIGCVAGLWIGTKINWLLFFKWLAAPTVTSLVFVSAFCIAAQSFLSSDEMFKYVNCYLLIFARFVFGCFGAGFIALKALQMTPEDKPPKP